MKVTLQLRYSPTPLRERRPVYSRRRPSGWLAEMTSWGVPLASAKLLVVPGETSTDAAGLLVDCQETKAGAATTALPYGQVAARCSCRSKPNWIHP